MAWTDSALGPLFDRLATQSRPTLVVVTGDHGESLGQHGELLHSIFAYESTLHVPLIVSEVRAGTTLPAPPKMQGVTIETPVRHIDILPTILDAEGLLPAGANYPGTSLRPVIASGGGDDRPSYFEAMTANVTRGWAPLRGVLVGREKYIDLPITELYDLTRDPEETTNIATVRTGRTEVLVNILKGFDMTPPGRPREETPDTLERLRSLGYVGGGTATVRERYTDDDDPKRLIELEQTMHRASEAYQEGRSSDAISLYRSVIAKRSDTEDAYRQLALIYWRDGRAADAIATLELALKNGVTQSEVRIKLGQYLAQSGQPGKAIALLESFGNDDPDALIALGNAYELAGRLPDAAKTFRHLIDLDPNNALAYQNLGIAQLQLKDDAGAETFLRKAIDLDPSLSGAYTALGVVLTNTNRKPEAIDVWKRAVALDAIELRRALQPHEDAVRRRPIRRSAHLRRPLPRDRAARAPERHRDHQEAARKGLSHAAPPTPDDCGPLRGARDRAPRRRLAARGRTQARPSVAELLTGYIAWLRYPERDTPAVRVRPRRRAQRAGSPGARRF